MDAIKNFPATTVSTAPAPATSGTSLVVADATVFPATPFNAVVWAANSNPASNNAEIVRVTNIATNTLTITRAQESTSARTIVVGDQIAQMLTKAWLDELVTAAFAGRDVFDPSWDGQGQVITGEVILVPVAVTQTLTQAALVADVSGSVTVTVKKYTPSAGALGSATTLGTVALSSAVHTRSTGLSWAVTAGDVLEFTPSSITSVKRLRAKLAA